MPQPVFWISLLLTVSVFLPLIRNDYWIFKILEYPRLQKLFLCLLVLGLCFIYLPGSTKEWISTGLLTAAVVYLIYKIFPYTPLSAVEMKNAPADVDVVCTVFAANVYQFNRNYQHLLNQIKKSRPDIIFLVETDHKWQAAAAILCESHPFTLQCPSDNTYGLLLFSRFPLDGQIRFLVKKDIPSVDTVVLLPSGDKFRLWGLHPEPPVPGENLYSTAKDKELLKVAFKVRDEQLPCLVVGDLNDVAWSYTTELFRKTSRLLDPRRGRGFYSTFHAKNPLIRFPLDYIFCSSEFRLVSMERLSANGSDHFPTLTKLALIPNLAPCQDNPELDAQELEAATEKASVSIDLQKD